MIVQEFQAGRVVAEYDDGRPEPTAAAPTIDAATAVTLGVALAVEAGVAPERAAEIVAEVTGG